VTAFGNTLTFPFEAERNARSYADGQASGSALRLRTQQARLTSDDYLSEGARTSSLRTK